MTQAVTCRHSDKIKKACAPLVDLFHLSHFGYCKLSSSGEFAYIGSNVAWSEYFADKELYLDFPYYRNPKFAPQGVKILSAPNYKTFPDVVDIGREKFNIHQSLAMFHKTRDGMEAFVFSTDSAESMHLSLLINELPLLRAFTHKFRADNTCLFRSAKDNAIDLKGLVGPQFDKNALEKREFDSKRETFLKTLEIDQRTHLSSQEIRVLQLAIQGYSASQIGLQLFLSKRTVEHHIERMKAKLGCQAKAELIQKGRELDEFGLLVK